MLSYLQKVRTRLVSLLAGVNAHTTTWTGQAETPTTIQANITSLDTVQGEITTLQHQLFQKQTEACNLAKSNDLVADTIENKAIGFHTAHPELLADYNIKLRKPSEKKSAPTAIIIPDIKDDSDGIGFIVSTQVDPDGDFYEWEKGVGADPTDLNTIPAMSPFKHTTKTSLVDDDVAKGVRYFYRVRAVNARGDGPWSAAVSRVQ